MARTNISQKAKQYIPTIQRLPKDLLLEIFGRVAAVSFIDIFNLKLSCKSFYETTRDPYIYQCISLDHIPVISWTPEYKASNAFLIQCEQANNPEIMYRKAVIAFFYRYKTESEVFVNLQSAIRLKHEGASFFLCILHLFCGNAEERSESVRTLAAMKKDFNLRLKLARQRTKLKDMINHCWVNNEDLKQYEKCCKKNYVHRIKRNNWVEYDWEEYGNCEECMADDEMRYLYDRFRRW